MSGADICVTDLVKTFETEDAAPVEVLKGVSFELYSGDSLAVTGPSGSGKSTLLQILGAMERATSGDVLVDGRNITTLDESGGAEFRNNEVGFVFQSHYLLPQLSVIDNVLVPAWNCRRESDKHVERAHTLLSRVGLKGFESRLPGQLSGGERQRVAVARALLMEPSLILADEPAGALDRSNTESLIELLQEMNSTEGATLVMVTHSEFCADAMHQQLQIVDGRISC